MTSGTPAGWYPNPDGSQSNRYWDGAQWTEHFGPANTPPPPNTAAPAMAPPPYQGAAGAPAPTGGGGSKKKWIIGGSIAAGVLLIGGIGSAMGAGRDAAPAPTVTVVAEQEPAESPSPEPVEEVEENPSPTPVETTAPADPAVFTSQAESHLDDILKDLDDIDVTIEERGFWRLLSNYGELSFNLGQLEGLDLPESMAKKWPATLAELDATMTAYSETIGTEDAVKMRDAVAAIRSQVEVTREVANTAE